MKILGIDSTSKILSVAVSMNNELKCEIVDKNSQKHMVNIADNIDSVLKKSDLSIKEIDMFCVNLGPGDFTGTRIGLSFAKVFSSISKTAACGADAIECFMFSTLESNYGYVISQAKSFPNIYIVPLLDVRNSQIYYNIYNIATEGQNNSDSKDFISTGYLKGEISISVLKNNFLEQAASIPDAIAEKIYDLSNPVYREESTFIILTGNYHINYPNMANCLKEKLNSKLPGCFFYFDNDNYFTRASTLNSICYLKYKNNKSSLPVFPVYAREFIQFGK